MTRTLVEAAAKVPGSHAAYQRTGNAAARGAGGADVLYLLLCALVFVFPSDPAAKLAPLGVPGQAYEWGLLAALAAGLVLLTIRRTGIQSAKLAAIALGIATWASFLILYSVLVTRNDLRYAAFGLVPYWFWMSVLIPAMVGPLRNWSRLINWVTFALVVAACVGGYALFFNHRLLVVIVQPQGSDVRAYLEMSYRLPVIGVYIAPFLVVAWIGRWRARGSSLRGLAGVATVCIVLVATTAAVQNRTTLLALILAVALLGRKGWTAKLVMAPIYTAVFVALVTAGFWGLSTTDPLLASKLRDRFGEGVKHPDVALRNSYVNSRDVLYRYSWETLLEHPVLGRGLGSVIDRGDGTNASMQDVTVLNHLDKSGLVGVALFLVLHLYLYSRARRGVRAYHERAGDGPEYELRLLFIRYYPLLVLMSLNVDILYKEPFVIVHGLLMGSLLLEGEPRPGYLPGPAPAGAE